MTIESICRKFMIGGEFISCEKINGGHINNTYKVVFRQLSMSGFPAGDTAYVLQSINTYVFPCPERIMHNIGLVTSHIQKKLDFFCNGNTCGTLHYLSTADGCNYLYDDAGFFWRTYLYIDNSVTFSSTDDLFLLEQTGEAFGSFQMYLDDFDASVLYECNPDFHNTKLRLDRLLCLADALPPAVYAEVSEELRFFSERYEMASRLCDMCSRGELPLRVTHNDAKCNNVVFDRDTGHALCVIDLDTVMPGLVANDFGDAVRSSASTASSSQTDLSKVSLDLEKFEALCRGFLRKAGAHLSTLEKDTLALGAVTITIELASRFLADHLTGDRYFSVEYPGQNLMRARNQIALAKDMEKKLNKMRTLVRICSQ